MQTPYDELHKPIALDGSEEAMHSMYGGLMRFPSPQTSLSNSPRLGVANEDCIFVE